MAWALAAVGLAITAPVQATIYTWTDAQGVLHYSDTSHPPSAKPAGITQTPASNGGGAATGASGAPRNAPAGDARALHVVSPQPGQVFNNTPGQVPVSVIVGNTDDKAGLGEGESLRYRLDGASIGQGPSRQTRLTLSNVAPGAHTLRVTLLYRGHAVQHSAPVSFRVLRGSGARPSNSQPPQSAAGRPPS
ncbi:DUF4124 domain-containing protein [Salinisphaera hydrothermalis]|uniref:DUF4124 domain-containing protein n=1 Tax=Salinisphaera hydrothermalis TaxID=563188 RepID=UPI0033424FD7